VASAEPAAVSNSGALRLLKCSLFSQLNRLNDVERAHEDVAEEPLLRNYLQTLGPELYWTISLLMRRHMFVYTPWEVIYAAEAVIKEMLKPVSKRLPSPFDFHFLALATLTLLEATDIPLFSNHCWDVLEKVDQILGNRDRANAEAGEFENLFATPGWDSRIRLFLERKRSKDQAGQAHNMNVHTNPGPSFVGPNEQRSLQHLADLAVGVEGVTANASTPPPTLPTSENHIIGATPATPRTHQSQQNRQKFVDFTRLTKYGYLNVFGHPKHSH
jgi:hypothetical protein